VASPRVSVIIPVRDHPGFLAESLASVFAQRFRDVEVIVVDDGSTDDLGPALAPYAGRIRVERQDPRGVAAATNRGAALATADVLAFHDADDLMEPDRIALPLARLAADPALALVFGNGVKVSADLRPLGPVIPAAQAAQLARNGLPLAELVRRSHVYLQASLVRRAVFLELGGLPPLPAGGDWAFALRCVARYPVAFVNAPLFRYRQHGGSLTAARVRMAAAAVAVLREFGAREPAAVARLGARTMARALARRLARLAAQELAAGDAASAATHWREASTLAPFVLRYRLRSFGARRAVRS
jgi:glycosyltransferase involved in cell wall biosynthesis